MKRVVNLSEISDGRLYGYRDMVKVDCHGCRDCHKCCTGMGNSVVLDPYDIWRLQRGLGKSTQELLAAGYIELNVVDGCILPNLAMTKGREEACAFLNEEGRCSIHSHRPGICRLFPLGRIYENGDFRFFLQTGECAEKNPTKVKVGKWIDSPGQEYHDFLCTWHYLLNDLEEQVKGREDSEEAKKRNMSLLQKFYFTDYTRIEDFFDYFKRFT